MMAVEYVRLALMHISQLGESWDNLHFVGILLGMDGADKTSPWSTESGTFFFRGAFPSDAVSVFVS